MVALLSREDQLNEYFLLLTFIRTGLFKIKFGVIND